MLAGFHEKFIPVYLHSAVVCKPTGMRIARTFFKKCIVTPRVYQPGFAIYITLALMEKHWLDYATAIGSTLTPILVLLLTGVGWHIKAKLERNRDKDSKAQARIRELEDKLRTDRIETYNQLLEPFFVLLTTDAIFASDPKFKGKSKDQLSIGKMLTVEYRKVGFSRLLKYSPCPRASSSALAHFSRQLSAS